MKIPQATARFSIVVARCGQPEPVTLWVSPQKNPSFQAALGKNRVLTVVQQTVGSKKDFGVVGFYKEPNVSYWVFPKSLAAFQDKRIVGIDYSLLKGPNLEQATGTFVPRVYRPPEPRESKKETVASAGRIESKKRSRSQPPPVVPVPALIRYRVKARCVVALEISRNVEATSKREARTNALAELNNAPMDFSAAKRNWRITGVEEV